MVMKKKKFSDHEQKLIKKHAEKPYNEIRRSEYAVDDQTWIKELLQRGAYGTLGTVYKDQPFVTPVSFVYLEKEHAIFIHGAKTGRMRSNIAVNPKVSFNITEFGHILAAEKAADFSLEYNSVTIFGRAAVVSEPGKAEHILQSLMDKYAPHLAAGIDYDPADGEDVNRTMVIEIKIESWSGKRQLNTNDQREAYDYPSVILSDEDDE
jgi:nitroimidazol reductase NimA-like FMN-containing flavoprotein (pyridoxamine 5'-phosphate oxidase superfamily)